MLSGAQNGERLSLLESRRSSQDSGEDDEPPTLSNFVDYIEQGHSRDKDPTKPDNPEAQRARRKLIRATGICFTFMVLEIVGGYVAGSLAIMTDAAHLLSDVAGFMISLFALYLGERKATLTLSYGFKRAEILGALLSVMLIWFLTGVLLWEAVLRTQGIINQTRDVAVDGKTMFIVAVVGLFANMGLLVVLGHDHSHLGGGHGHSHGGVEDGGEGCGGDDHGHGHGHGTSDIENDHGHSHSHGHGHGHGHGSTDSGDHGHGHGSSDSGDHGHGHGAPAKAANKPKHVNINVSAAYVHAIGDLIQSAGVCVAGGLIWAFPAPEHRMMQLADPIATFLFSVLVLMSTYGILKTSMNVLMEGVPAGINPRHIASSLRAIQGVAGVHHLHIWSLTVGEPSLSVHLLVVAGTDMEETLQRAQHVLRELNIGHSTVQIEAARKETCSTSDCAGTPCNAYALACHDDSNCFDDFSFGGMNSPYGAIANGRP